MNELLGVLMPSLISVVIKTLKIEDNDLKTIIALLTCVAVAIPVQFLANSGFSKEGFVSSVTMLFTMSQISYIGYKKVKE